MPNTSITRKPLRPTFKAESFDNKRGATAPQVVTCSVIDSSQHWTRLIQGRKVVAMSASSNCAMRVH